MTPSVHNARGSTSATKAETDGNDDDDDDDEF